MTTLQVPPAPLVFGLKDFFKGEFICRVFPPANTNKGLSPHSCRAHHTPGCDTHCPHRNQPWESLLVLLIFYPSNDVTSSNTVPAAWKTTGFPSLPSASFGADPALPVHLLLFPKPISISKGLIHAPSQGPSHLAKPQIIVITVITKGQANFGTSYNFVPTSPARKLLFFHVNGLLKKKKEEERQHPLHICYI